MLRIYHHRIKCIGCNYCIEAAPYRWEMNTSDGKSTLKDSTEKKGFYIAIVSDDELEDNLEAANICPVNIIRVEKV